MFVVNRVFNCLFKIDCIELPSLDSMSPSDKK